MVTINTGSYFLPWELNASFSAAAWHLTPPPPPCSVCPYFRLSVHTTPPKSFLSVSMLLSASVESFGVSCIWNFFHFFFLLPKNKLANKKNKLFFCNDYWKYVFTKIFFYLKKKSYQLNLIELGFKKSKCKLVPPSPPWNVNFLKSIFDLLFIRQKNRFYQM